MKHILFFAILLCASNLISAQEKYEEIARSQAIDFVKALNEKDYVKFVDYLQYKFEDKTKLYELWEKILKNNTRIASNVNLEKFGVFDSSQQAYFTCKYADSNASFLGISVDSGENWHFTQFIREFNYEQIKKRMMSQLDSSFAEFDPSHGKRISYNAGEQITPFEYEDINGNLLKSESLRGKIIVLNFWSTSCLPCIKEMPQLNELVEKMKDKDVVFIGLASNENKQDLKDNFLTKHKFLYQIVPIKGDDYNVNPFPTHVIIGRDQKVVGKYIGGSEENLKKIELLLDKL